MHSGSLSHSGVHASFEKGAEGHPHIRFSDPAYVRAETILFQPDTRAVHAILHESLIYIGQVPEPFAEAFARHEDVILTAHHYSGNPVTLKAKISRSHG